MRQDVVDILQYLPAFLAESTHFKSANDADSKEHDTIRLDLQDLINQCYVDTATWGLATWEDLVGIKKPASTLAARRAAVKSRLQATYSVTLEFMNDVVNQYIANKSAVVVDVPSDYRVDITIYDGQVLSWTDLMRAIRIWIPAHLGYKIIAESNASVNMYTGVAVSLCDIYNIEAQADYETPAPELSSYTGAVVSVADYQHIDADIYR